ncbi:hypothetical protein CMI47_11255 [Candidatus Pacearchaeota archaeon]|nr:hypothetical protein [Candidatus Pacearchaeota archaeon]|tara:strand:- start:2576 stop:2932 length:357 start_codon:yes stop_codon:yes gene_type:complete
MFAFVGAIIGLIGCIFLWCSDHHAAAAWFGFACCLVGICSDIIFPFQPTISLPLTGQAVFFLFIYMFMLVDQGQGKYFVALLLFTFGIPTLGIGIQTKVGLTAVIGMMLIGAGIYCWP